MIRTRFNVIKFKLQAMTNQTKFLLAIYPALTSMFIVACLGYLYFIFENVWRPFRGVHIPFEFSRMLYSVATIYLQSFNNLFILVSIAIAFASYYITDKLLNKFYYLPFDYKKTILSMSTFYGTNVFTVLIPFLGAYIIALSPHWYVLLWFSTFIIMAYYSIVILTVHLAIIVSRLLGKLLSLRGIKINFFNISIFLAGLCIYSLTVLVEKIAGSIIYLYPLVLLFLLTAVILTLKANYMWANIIKAPLASKIRLTDVWTSNMPFYCRIGLLTIGRNFDLYTYYFAVIIFVAIFSLIFDLPLDSNTIVGFSAPLVAFSLGIKCAYRLQFLRLPINKWSSNCWDLLQSFIVTFSTFFSLVVIFDINLAINCILMLIIISFLIYIIQYKIRLTLHRDEEVSLIFYFFYSAIASIMATMFPKLFVAISSYLS